MSGRLEVICGTAGSGKTARFLNLFRQVQAKLLKACTPGGAVWITPTHRSRRDTARRLLDASLRACLAPNVLTFDSFAERLLRTSSSQIVSLSPVARRMIARAVVDDVQATGSLPYFTPIARTSGFLDLFLNFISELKRDETWPEQFEQSCRQRGWLPREAELSLLYNGYQTRLNSLSLYDAEGRFWSARSALEEGRRGAFDRLALVIVDGFTDFTQPQYEILEHLSDNADRVIVSLPLENPCVRSDLFAKSAVALAEIDHKKRATVTWLEPPPLRSKRVEATFRHIAGHLFGNPARHAATGSAGWPRNHRGGWTGGRSTRSGGADQKALTRRRGTRPDCHRRSRRRRRSGCLPRDADRRRRPERRHSTGTVFSDARGPSAF